MHYLWHVYLGEALESVVAKSTRNNWKAQLQGLTGYVPKVVAEFERGDATTFLAMTSGAIVLHATPESALAGLTGLDADGMAFAEAALRLAMVGQQNDKTVEAMLTRLEADRAAAASGTGLVDEFEAALKAAALALSAAALTACVETTNPMPTPAVTGGNLTSVAANACRSAIARQTGRPVLEVAVFDVAESEVGVGVMATVAGAEAPWACQSSPEGVRSIRINAVAAAVSVVFGFAAVTCSILAC